MAQDTLIEKKGTILEAMIFGKWYNWLFMVRDRRIFIDINAAFFQAVVHYPNYQEYHIS